MSDTILSRHAFDLRAAPFQQGPFQAQVDGLVGRFIEEAASPTTLGALMAGGMAYRLTRVGVLGLGSTSFLRPLSMVAGLGSEVGTYEFASRSFLSLSGNATNPDLWRWDGAGGWRAGLLSSAVSFGMLKGAGALGREQNLLLQHALQSTAMVAGHQATGLLGMTPRPEGSLAEQFLHAEITNLQLGAGISLAHAVAPGIHSLERGLDLSASLRPTAGFEGSFPEFPQRMAATSAPRPSSSSVLEESPFLQMSSSNDPPDGSGKPPGRGRERPPTDPSRARTLPGLEPRRPSQTGLSRMIFRVEGFAETLATLEAHRRERAPFFEELLSGVQTHFKTRGGSLVVHLSGDALSSLEQAELRVDLNRFFREANAPEGTALAIYSSTQVRAVVFTRRGGFLHIEEGKVKVVAQPLPETSGETKVQEPVRTMTLHGLGGLSRQPGSSGTNLGSIPQVSDSLGIKNLLDRVLAQEEPTIHFTGPQWTHASESTRIVEWLEGPHRLPRGKTLTLLVDNPSGLRVIFHWGTEENDRNSVWWRTERTEAARGRPPSVPSMPQSTEIKPPEKRRPTVPPPLPPPPPPPPVVSRGKPIVEKQGPDIRSDQINCGTPTEVFAALRGLLSPPKGDFIPAPAIRMVRGHLAPPDLSSLAKVLGDQEFRLPEGYKILIHWVESPSGLITLQRRGDHITAEVKGLQWKNRNFLFLREMPRSGQWGVYEPSQVRFYPQFSGSDFEKEIEDEIRKLAGEIWTDESTSPFHFREEGSSFRGGALARLAVHLLKNRPLRNLGFSSQEWEWIEGIHTQLERAYTFLDFDTLRIFSERVGEDRMRGYRAAVEQYNQRAPAEGKPSLVPLEKMAFDMSGSYVIPSKLHLRHPFILQIFQGNPAGRSPRENLSLLNDPIRLGEAYRVLFENYIRTLLPVMELLKNKAKQGGLANIPIKAKEGLDPDLVQLRERFFAHFQDLVEYRRILGEGWGNFRVDFLRTVFNEHRPLFQLYRTLYFRVGELEGELQRQVNLPSIEELQRLMRTSSPH